MKQLGLILIRGYQRLLSPILGCRCRYYPTCSDYAYEAIDLHGFFKGFWLAAHRLGRCTQVGGQGYDPVPETTSSPKWSLVLSRRICWAASERPEKETRR